MKYFFIIGFALLVSTHEARAQLNVTVNQWENFFSEFSKGKRYIDTETFNEDYVVRFRLSKKDFHCKRIVDSLVTAAFRYIPFARQNFSQRILIKIVCPGVFSKRAKYVIDVDKVKLIAFTNLAYRKKRS